MEEERAAERLKLGKEGGDDDKITKEISSVNPVADFMKMINNRTVD